MSRALTHTIERVVPLVYKAIKITSTAKLDIKNVLEVVNNAFGFTNAKPIDNDTKDLAVFYINAEGKANTVEQIKVLIESITDKTPKHASKACSTVQVLLRHPGASS